MKHDDLRSIAHNIADSLASGIGLLIGVYKLDVFGEAAQSPEGQITVDFLRGVAIDGLVSPSLGKALGLYRDALPGLCERHGVAAQAFRLLTARYFVAGIYGRRFIVTVEDHLGRVRRKPGKRTPLAESLK